MTRRVILTVCAGLLAVGATAREINMYDAGQPHSFEPGLFGGYMFGGDVRDEGFVPGVQLTYIINDYLALQIFTFLGGDTVSQDFRAAGVDWTTEMEFDIVDVGASGRVSLPLPLGISVYGLAGLDAVFINEDDPSFEPASDFPAGAGIVADLDGSTEDKYGWHWGVGADVALNRNIRLFVQYLYFLTDLEANWKSQVTSTRDRPLFDELGEPTGATLSRSEEFMVDFGIDQAYEFAVLMIGLSFWY